MNNPNPPNASVGEPLPSLKELVERAEKASDNLKFQGSTLARNRIQLVRQGVQRIFQMRAIKLAQGMQMADEFEPWLIHNYKYEKGQKTGESYRPLIITGMLQPNCLDDWSVDRKEADLSRRLGIRNFTALEQLTSSHAPEPNIGMEVGPGDGLFLQELQLRNPEWIYLGIGDRMYFSLERLLMKFVVALQDSNLVQFVDIFLRFVKREFRERYQKRLGKEVKQGGVDLNVLYQILLSARDWVRNYFDPLSGDFRKSEEFEFDTAAHMGQEVLRLFHELLDSPDIERFYQKFFSSEFLKSLSQNTEQRLDLNRFPEFNDKGFVPARFEEIDQLIYNSCIDLRNDVNYMFGCRSDSHLRGEAYVDFLAKALLFLKPGGVYISDGVKESYTRILRYEGIYNLLKRRDLVGKYRALAVLQRKTGRPLSVYIEAGKPCKDSYKFYSQEKLRRLFDGSEVHLIPLEEVIAREKYETILREEIFRELEFGRDAFYLVNDAIEAAADLMRHSKPMDLLSALEAVSELASDTTQVDDDTAYKRQVFCEAIMALFEIRLEVMRKEACPANDRQKLSTQQ